MDKELALRTFGYLIGHYKTHDETIINSQEIEAIEFILKDNEDLEQQCKKQKEVIDNIQNFIKEFHKNRNTFKWNEQDYIDVILKLEKMINEKEVSE